MHVSGVLYKRNFLSTIQMTRFWQPSVGLESALLLHLGTYKPSQSLTRFSLGNRNRLADVQVNSVMFSVTIHIIIMCKLSNYVDIEIRADDEF